MALIDFRSTTRELLSKKRTLASRSKKPRRDNGEQPQHDARDDTDARTHQRHHRPRGVWERHGRHHRHFLLMTDDVMVEEQDVRGRHPDAVDDAHHQAMNEGPAWRSAGDD